MPLRPADVFEITSPAAKAAIAGVGIKGAGEDIERTLQERAGDWRSLMAYVPASERDAILAGTSTWDATAAIEKAIASGRSVLLPPTGKARVTRAINAKGSNKAIVSPGRFVFESPDISQPIMRVGGLDCDLAGFDLEYTTMPADIDTGANALEIFGLRRSRVNGVRAIRCYRGFYLAQEEMSAGEGRNFLFSTEIRNIEVLMWRREAVHLYGWNAGNTGCTFHNWYLNNFVFGGDGTKRQATFGVALDNWSECKLTQLNIEHSELTASAINIGSSVRTIAFDQLHMEGLDMFGTASGMIRSTGGAIVDIQGWDLYKIKILTANLDNDEFHWLRLGTLGQFRIEGLRQSQNGESGFIDVGIPIAIYTGSATNGARIRGNAIRMDNVQVTIVNQPSSIEPILFEWNGPRISSALQVVGNANASMSAVTPPGLVMFETALTANRTYTITSSTPWNNHECVFKRSAAATGAFSIDIGGLASLTAAGQSVRLKWTSSGIKVI